ncbi:glycosyltransferase family 2 protein, partial [bacterium]|nr:glycosyltransferase family 2 protein [bacterium]
MENLNQYSDYINTFKQNNCCIILPTFNNAKQIGDVIHNINKFCNDIIVINDGSNDNTLDVLSKIENIQLISYTKNKGKGYALKKGFEYALELGFEYAITMDADGQHYA